MDTTPKAKTKTTKPRTAKPKAPKQVKLKPCATIGEALFEILDFKHIPGDCIAELACMAFDGLPETAGLERISLLSRFYLTKRAKPIEFHVYNFLRLTRGTSDSYIKQVLTSWNMTKNHLACQLQPEEKKDA